MLFEVILLLPHALLVVNVFNCLILVSWTLTHNAVLSSCLKIFFSDLRLQYSVTKH